MAKYDQVQYAVTLSQAKGHHWSIQGYWRFEAVAGPEIIQEEAFITPTTGRLAAYTVEANVILQTLDTPRYQKSPPPYLLLAVWTITRCHSLPVLIGKNIGCPMSARTWWLPVSVVLSFFWVILMKDWKERFSAVSTCRGSRKGECRWAGMQRSCPCNRRGCGRVRSVCCNYR